MDVKKLQKKYGITLDEEKDAFLSSLNKRYRNNRKKLDAIEDLEKRDKATLKAEQLEKIKNKAEILENGKYLDGVRDMYYAALKTAQDEGKLPKTTEAAAPTKTEEQPSEAKTPEVKPEPVQQKQVPTQSAEERQAELAGISRDNLSKIVNLVHFAQFFKDHHRVQEFRQVFEANRGDFQLESAPEFEIVSEFYTKVFNFTESDKLGKVGDKTNRSVGELEHYVNGADQPALRNKTYRHLQHVVEGVVSSAFFRDHSADIEVHHKQQHHHHHEHGAIGSTRKGHETEKLDVPAEADQLVPHVGGNAQEKHKSPEKAHHHAEPAKTQPQEHKPDWTAVEDEEEEGAEEYEGEEGEEQGGAEEEKQEKKGDDGWATVASKKKEKKEEPFRGSGSGFRGRGRGGRGGRGGYRGERKPRPEGEAGQEGERHEGGERRGGYRGPRYERRAPGEEGVEGENAGEGQREGGYRGGRGGHRGGFRGHRGEGRGGYRGEGRGGYRGEGRGGYRGPRQEYTERPAGSEVVNKQE